MATPTAMIINPGADEDFFDAQIRQALDHGLVPCARATVRHDKPFCVTFIAPDHIPSGWRRLAVKSVAN